MPFHDSCSSFHPSLSLSLSGYSSLPLYVCLSQIISEASHCLNILSFPISRAATMEPSLLSVSIRGLNNFCLISMQRIQKTHLSMFFPHTGRGEQGRCLLQQMSSLSFYPNTRNTCSFKNSMISSFDGNMPKF